VSRSLTLDAVTAHYGKVRALHEVSATFEPGAVSAVVGPNGAGKSTLFLAIRGTVPVTGSLRLGDADVRSLPARDRITRVAIVPQGRQVFPRLTVRENLQVMAGLLRTGRAGVDAALERFPVLGTRARSYAGVLSGGEQQMLAISRALMGSPEFLLLDEPFTGLAPRIVGSIAETLAELAGGGTGVVIAEPSVESLRGIAERGAVLVRGTVAAVAADVSALDVAYRAAMGIDAATP
jgi:branched-chain amino acid transport system ATP-binding protein